MATSANLQAMLDVGVGLIPDLVRGAAGHPEADPGAPAPDLEGYLKSLHQATQTQQAINRLRADELAMGAPVTEGQVTPEAALEVLLGASVTFRRGAVEALLASVPQKGMKP